MRETALGGVGGPQGLHIAPISLQQIAARSRNPAPPNSLRAFTVTLPSTTPGYETSSASSAGGRKSPKPSTGTMLKNGRDRMGKPLSPVALKAVDEVSKKNRSPSIAKS